MLPRAAPDSFLQGEQIGGSIAINEATYVDDEMLAVAAYTPKGLDRRIALLLHSVLLSFSELALRLNFDRGKSEALLRYRGRGASAAVDRRRTPTGLVVKLPPAAEKENLYIVAAYKHVGTYVAANGSVYKDSCHRATQAAAAYAPLARKIFSSPQVTLRTRAQLAKSLVLSTLLNAVHL